MTDLLCLHGFLGTAQDFDFLKTALLSSTTEVAKPVRVVATSRFGGQSKIPTALNEEAREIASQLTCGTHVLGYSLGARLALHVALQSTRHLQSLILISSHFGLELESDRVMRQANDELWAKRFETDDWASVVDGWNQQSVFSHSKPTRRSEAGFDRVKLAQSLRQQGLGSMRSLWSQLSQIRVPTLLIVGANDLKYLHLAERAQKIFSNAQLAIVPGAGHRVMSDAPDECAQVVAAFIGQAHPGA